MHDLVYGDIVNYCIAEIIVFEFFFLDISRHNGLDYYRYNIYYYLNFVFNTIIIFQTQINNLLVANRKLND